MHNSVSVSLQNEKRAEVNSYEVHTEIHILAFLSQNMKNEEMSTTVVMNLVSLFACLLVILAN